MELEWAEYRANYPIIAKMWEAVVKAVPMAPIPNCGPNPDAEFGPNFGQSATAWDMWWHAGWPEGKIGEGFLFPKPYASDKARYVLELSLVSGLDNECEWFFRDRQTDEMAGDEFKLEDGLPPDLVERFKIFC